MRRDRTPYPAGKRTGRLALYIILLIATISVMAAIRSCSHGDEKASGPEAAQSARGDTLRVAITYGPLDYVMSGDSIAGLSYEMIEAMSRDLGKPVRYYPVVNTSQSLKALDEGGYDMFASLPVAASLRKKYLFTDNIYLDRLVLIQPAGHKPLESVIDLAGKTVHIQNSAAAQERLSNIADEIGARIDIQTHEDLSDEYIFMKVATGEWDYAVINGMAAEQMVAKHPSVAVVAPVGFSQFQAWVFRRTQTRLQKSVDEWLEKFRDTEECRALYRKYNIVDSITH